MDNTLIYLEWESKPFIKEELAERIMQEAAGKDEKLFSDFKDEYEDTDFIYLDKSDKQKRVLADFAQLKSTNKWNASWKDQNQLKKDIINSVTPLHPDENGKLLITKRLWQINIDGAVLLALAIKKKAYFSEMLDDLSKDIIPGAKIKWNRNISEFGFMMTQLVEKGYLVVPAGPNSESSTEQFAKILFNCFDIGGSISTLTDALNEERNYLSDKKREKLEEFPHNFPDAQELGSMKKQKVKRS